MKRPVVMLPFGLCAPCRQSALPCLEAPVHYEFWGYRNVRTDMQERGRVGDSAHTVRRCTRI